MKKKVILITVIAAAILVVAAIAVTLVLVLSNREEPEVVLNIGDLLNDEAVYDEEPLILNDGAEVSTLEKANLVSKIGNLAYFKEPASVTPTEPVFDPITGDPIDVEIEPVITYERHVVYNIETGKALYNTTESDKLEIEVSLHDIEDSTFFVIQTTRYNLDKDKIRTSVTNMDTVLYDYVGNKVESVTGIISATSVEDIVYFNGKCYRVQDNGALNYAFDYSVLSAFPEGINAKAGDKYYAIDRSADKGIKVYDNQFKFLYEVEVPSYVDFGTVVFLAEEKLLLQYTNELDEDANEFSFIYLGKDTEEIKNMSKHNLVTLIYDPATGISEEIECPYVFVNSLFDYSYYAYDKEFDDVTTEAAQAILYGLEIVDGYLSTSAVESGRTVAVNAEHAFVDVAEINGEPITDFYMIGKNKWSVRTLNYEYLVDGTGTIIGEMSNASVNYDLFYNGEPIYDEEGANAGFNYSGMIFDSNLSLIYNAPSEKRSVVNVLEGTFLLKNYDGEIFCFDGSNSKKIISKKNVEDCSYFVLDSSLIVVVDATDEEDINIEFYNAKGEKIFTTDFESVSDMEESVISSESAVLVPYVDADGNRAFYRFN